MNLIYAHDIYRGCIITQAGYYQLAENINWDATHANSRAITIACDNVTIDFAGFTLHQTNTLEPLINTQPYRGFANTVISGNIGVWAENHQGITIKNGNISNIQGVGICLKNCSSIDLSDLNVRNCGRNGAIDTSFLYRNGGIFVIGTNAKKPNDIIWASNIRMMNCICSHNSSELDFIVTLGSLIQNCENIEIKDCIFNSTNNTSSKPSGVQFNVVGIDFVMCRNVLVENCEAHNNTSGGEVAGFFAWGENYRFVNCRAHNNYTLAGHYACGFNISTTTHLEMIHCEANNNYNANPSASSDLIPDFSACGFRLGRSVNHATIKYCHAKGNYNISSNAPIAGFILNSTQNIIVQDCTATENYSVTGKSKNKTLIAGFIASATLPNNKTERYCEGKNNTFINCIAHENTIHHVLIHHQSFPHINSQIEINNDQITSAGFILENQENTKIIASHILANKGAGIWLRNSVNSVIEKNHIISNGYNSIYDETHANSFNNLIINNKIQTVDLNKKDNEI
ncbi:MAG TPA: right-handed parallel beta-helix repeat-containing protein [Pasteurellaceae bacterium]|nr:right-handed parallel beta-helix repeat-containing protein [Pasteurellaceae bacterium]